MADTNTTPPAIQDGYRRVVESDVCAEVGPLTRAPRVAGLFSFVCGFSLPHPNLTGLPERLSLKAILSDAYPYKSVEFYPVDGADEPAGFAHQDAESGKLCLRPEQDAPCDSSRLLVYVEWAREWLHDAANGTLLRRGEPFELPDFSRKSIRGQFPTDRLILIDESATTYSVWQDRLGQFGRVELHRIAKPRVLIAHRFFAGASEPIRTSSFALSKGDHESALRGCWLLLPTLVSFRHRPAQTFEELIDLCEQVNVSLRKPLKQAWIGGSKSHSYSVLLVGCPIPAVVGGPPVEVHWQPLLLPNKEATKKALTWKKGKRDEGRLWNHAINDGPFAKARPLYWGKVQNLARERQFARGAFPPPTQQKSIAIVGCGALGSMVAESLCRGGVQELALFDEQQLEFGNLCRHTLDGRDVPRTKAAALGDRLLSINMTTRVSTHSLHVPWAACETGGTRALSALALSDVLVDCTTDHSAFVWMSKFAKQRRKRLASLFINPHATLLTLVVSGKQTSAEKVYRSLMQSIDARELLIDVDAYFSDLTAADAVLPGVGCWHATFPALNSDIASLAYAAVHHLSNWCEQREQCDGFGIVIRRNTTLGLGPIVETIWKEPYR